MTRTSATPLPRARPTLRSVARESPTAGQVKRHTAGSAPVVTDSLFACAVSAIALTVLLTPAILRLAAGGGRGQRTGLTLLLLETLYLFCAAVSVGATRVGALRRIPMALLLIVPMTAFFAAGVCLGTGPRPLLVAQPTIAAAGLFGWGIGRVGRRLGRGPAESSALVWLLAALALVSVLPASHLAETLSSRPRLGEIVLAANPLVAVTGAAGFDLLRTESLYAGLTLSSYRFDYPDPFTAPAVLAALGLVLGGASAPRRGARSRIRSGNDEEIPS